METAEGTNLAQIALKRSRINGRNELIIVGIAFLARLFTLWFAIVAFPHGWLYSRGIELGTLAHSLRSGRGLSSPFGGSTGPTALLGPGYPAIIAVLFGFFGSFSFAAAIAIMAMQLCFGVLTVFLMFHIAKRHFGTPTATLAAAFWALSLPALWMPTIFWDSSLLTLLLIGSLALALRCEKRASLPLWLLIGAYSALSALVNPALLPTLLAIMGWLAWNTRREPLYWPTCGLLLFCLMYAPWPIRNMLKLHAIIPLRSTIGLELWMGNRPGATGFLDESQFPIFNKGEFNDYVLKGEVAYMRDKRKLALAYIEAHPALFLKRSTIRFIRFWSGTGSNPGSVIFFIHSILTTGLGFIGLRRLFKDGNGMLALLFLLPLTLFPFPYYITHAEFRYRLVIDPLVTILAAYGITKHWRCDVAKV